MKASPTLFRSKTSSSTTDPYNKKLTSKRSDFNSSRWGEGLSYNLRSEKKPTTCQVIQNPKILTHVEGIPTFAEVKSAWGYIYKYGDKVITLDKILEARGADEAGGYIIGSDPLCDIR